jgi:dihydroorotate dehydrogenase
MYRLLRPLLFALDAEVAHRLGARALRVLGHAAFAGPLRRRLVPTDPRLAVVSGRLRLEHPLALAAGFDKGEGLAAGLFALGFAAVEVGTVTPRPQPGNPRPRLFRLPASRALINRMGFNNDGAALVSERYARLAFHPGLLGLNLGKNKDTPAERAVDDYLAVFSACHRFADYVVVNVSSPNTPGLRDLQAPTALRGILEPLLLANQAGPRLPLLLKLAPDLPDDQILELAGLARSLGLDGLILANTTLGRSAVAREPRAGEAGGLSGAPLLPRMLWLVSLVWRQHGDHLPIVAAGGLASGADVWAAVGAGAAWAQAYTGFVYGGPGFVRAVLADLRRQLDRSGAASLAAVRGSTAATVAPAPPMP